MKIGIISLGLIGGSILKSLSNSDNELFAITQNEETIKKALLYTKHVSKNLSDLYNCDIVFVASPINKTVEILDKLENIVSPECIVLDCASVKEFIMKKQRPYKFIGSHPMAGTEFSGFDASFPELFNGAKWVLTPSGNIADNDINKTKNIISLTGAETIITTPKLHDEAVALISHMPLIVSQAILHCASDNNIALKLASSGFRDMTRLAMSNLTMAQDMKTYNKEQINLALQKLNNSINILKQQQENKLFSELKSLRTNMYSQDGKNQL